MTRSSVEHPANTSRGRPAPAHRAPHRRPGTHLGRRLRARLRPRARDTRDPAIKIVARAVADSTATRAGIALLRGILPPTRVHLTRYEIAVARLPRHLDGLRILHVSDLHLHPGSDLAWEVPDLVAGVPHDLLCYTGDFIDVDDDIPGVARLLARMPRSATAYAVLGNHDYIPFGRSRGANDARRLRGVLAGAGVMVLSNEAHAWRGEGFYIAGVDDPATGRDHAERAMAHVPDHACTLLLAHSPDVALRLAPRRPDLILAGHTHGGQIRLWRIGPLLTLSELPRHLTMGVGAHEGVPLFVSRGIGYSGLHIRIGSPPEVALLTLRSPAAHRRRHGAGV